MLGSGVGLKVPSSILVWLKRRDLLLFKDRRDFGDLPNNCSANGDTEEYREDSSSLESSGLSSTIDWGRDMDGRFDNRGPNNCESINGLLAEDENDMSLFTEENEPRRIG